MACLLPETTNQGSFFVQHGTAYLKVVWSSNFLQNCSCKTVHGMWADLETHSDIQKNHRTEHNTPYLPPHNAVRRMFKISWDNLIFIHIFVMVSQ